MKPIHWQTAALAVLVVAGWQTAALGDIQVHSLASPITGQPAQLVPPGLSVPLQTAPSLAIPRHSGFKPELMPPLDPAPWQLDLPGLTTEKSLSAGQGFDAINELLAGAGNTPPDPNVAIGTVVTSTSLQYLVETVNRGLQAFDQNGNPVTGYTQFASFFGSSGLFDPRLVFDPYAKRFFAIALENGMNRGHIHVAVSATADPRGAWSVFRTDVPFTPTVYYPDYPSLGFDRQALYLGVNLFSGSTSGPPQALLYRAISKASMLSASPQITTMIDVVETLGSTEYHWSMRAAQVLDLPLDAVAEGLFIGTFRNSFQPNKDCAKLRVVKMRKPLAAVRVSLKAFDVAVPAYAEPAVDARQLANCASPLETIDVSSGQLLNAVWRKDDLYAAHTVRRQAGFPPKSVDTARWYQIRTGPPGAPAAWSQLVQSGQIYGSTFSDLRHTYLPTVGVDAQGSLVVAYAQSFETEPVSFRIAARTVCDAEGLMPYRLLAKVANHCYKEITAGTPPFRWGDYWAVAVDPANPTRLWTVGEYVPSPNRWGTWVQPVEVVPECPSCAAATAAATAQSVIGPIDSFPLGGGGQYHGPSDTVPPNLPPFDPHDPSTCPAPTPLACTPPAPQPVIQCGSTSCPSLSFVEHGGSQCIHCQGDPAGDDGPCFSAKGWDLTYGNARAFCQAPDPDCIDANQNVTVCVTEPDACEIHLFESGWINYDLFPNRPVCAPVETLACLDGSPIFSLPQAIDSHHQGTGTCGSHTVCLTFNKDNFCNAVQGWESLLGTAPSSYDNQALFHVGFTTNATCECPEPESFPF